jgi:hypothetical protein
VARRTNYGFEKRQRELKKKKKKEEKAARRLREAEANAAPVDDGAATDENMPESGPDDPD